MTHIREIENELDRLSTFEETYWWQCSRAEWLSDGNRNIKYFYIKASARKSKSFIQRIKDESGQWVSKKEEIAKVVEDYFCNIFKSSSPFEELLRMGYLQLLLLFLLIHSQRRTSLMPFFIWDPPKHLGPMGVALFFSRNTRRLWLQK